MKKVFMVLLMAVTMVGLVSCGSSKKTQKDAAKEIVKFVKVEYERQFDESLSKYDDALAKAHDIIQTLDEVESNLESLPELLTAALEDISELTSKTASDMSQFLEAKNNPEAMMKFFKDELIKMDAALVIQINSDGTITPRLVLQGVTTTAGQVDAITEEIKAIFEPFIEIKNNMVTLADDSKSLATQLTDLAKSAKSDFSGKNAMKAPKAIKALSETAKTLGEVPGRLKGIGENIPGIVKALSAMA
jgi:myosin heavy subunit